MAQQKPTSEKKPKKNGMFKQIVQIYKFTQREDKSLPWLLGVAFACPIIGFIVLALIFHWSWIGWIASILLGIMLGFLLFTIVLTNRADKVGYRQLEGQPGAAVSVLNNMQKAGFTFPQEPVWVDPRTQAAVWRGTGYGGIYLVGEGDYGQVMRAMDRQEKQIKGVTAGSHIPIYRIAVGTGPKQVRLKDLRRTIVKKKSYVPTDHKNAAMKKMHSKRRFMMTKDQLATLNDRLRTLQRKQGYGIPKGIDPMHPGKVSRRAMRGR
ncbi:DUF4191 domain-containing protein [Bifidobacterium gallicum]|uniref:Membrane protein n=1 Tax=Bifidobacterium gallicum DSM 20093 = LMG 11596 TaxID=561180 RepID=D1NU02_9BIFI|nr:DUF4191 domain-containing protein [Bifidobacterium gallicum]EFA23206.1 hypothetical protein BIFGAL_03323 [Bifidobacterium gallicum DSM 20093 = LMG 11596]KFI58868.1 membrane protein [Bifidobacterium gallicum DSM 20093 = LMG 11596]